MLPEAAPPLSPPAGPGGWRGPWTVSEGGWESGGRLTSVPSVSSSFPPVSLPDPLMSSSRSCQALLSLAPRPKAEALAQPPYQKPHPCTLPATQPSPAPNKWCNQRQLFKLGERSPPRLSPASEGGGGLAGRTPESWAAFSEPWGLLLQPLSHIANPGQGLDDPAFRDLSLSSFAFFFAASVQSPVPTPTPPPIIIGG